ncbi:putative pumilio homolog 8, chloroplastic [Juglans regia]|uniref:Pumilio homolog 8, chloroplastic n=2 Tax=Juglans regia TaxID=51240 RepID=A0A2I4F7A3_JUGRE|nr:putative pumilio homolog 8, chloroplastic [Juglans regia]
MEKGEKQASDFQCFMPDQKPIDPSSISPRESHRLVVADSLANHNDGNRSSGNSLHLKTTIINPRVQTRPISQNQIPTTGSVNFQDAISGMDLNPGLNYETLLEQGLETSLRRLTLSTPSHQSSFLAPPASQEDAWCGSTTGPSLGNGFDDNYVMAGGLAPSTHAQECQGQQYLEKLREQHLQSMRIRSAVMGHMVYDTRPRGVPLILSNDYELSSSRPSFANYLHRNLSGAGPSFGTGKNQSASSSSSNINNVFDWHRGRQSADTMSYDYPIWPSSPSCNGIRFDSNFQSRGISSNGLRSAGIFSLQQSQQRPTSYPSIEELNGQLLSVAKDRSWPGYAFFQKKFEKWSDDLHALMVHPRSSHHVQKRFEESNGEQLTEILLALISNEQKLKYTCTDSQGSRSMQKLLEHLTPEHISLVKWAIRNLTLTLAKSSSGQFVIKKCLELFPAQDNELIMNEIAENCFDIATDRYGCCVMQECVNRAFGETRKRLVAKIVANALLLSEDSFGNFVVQHVIGQRMPLAAEAIHAQLEGRFLSLSMNKHGSHVVQKCLIEFGEQLSARIIRELTSIDPERFLSFLQDQWGNYVAQTAKAVSKGSVHQSLMDLIDHYRPLLQSHPHGKCVLAPTKGKQQRLKL